MCYSKPQINQQPLTQFFFNRHCMLIIELVEINLRKQHERLYVCMCLFNHWGGTRDICNNPMTVGQYFITMAWMVISVI